MLRRHVDYDVRGCEVVGAARSFARAFDIAVRDDALDPAVRVCEDIKLRGGGAGFSAGVGGSYLGMAGGDGVASAEFRVKFDGNFVGGDCAAALAHVCGSVQLNHAIVAADFHAAACGGDGQAATLVRRCEVELYVVS